MFKHDITDALERLFAALCQFAASRSYFSSRLIIAREDVREELARVDSTPDCVHRRAAQWVHGLAVGDVLRHVFARTLEQGRQYWLFLTPGESSGELSSNALCQQLC